MKRVFTALLSLLLCLSIVLAALPVIAAEDIFFGTAELLEIKSHIEKDAGMGEYATVQGACTDGKYAYFAVQESGTVILKYDMSTWKLKKKAAVDGLGHANDMTYNSKDKYIVVANNYTGDDLLTVLDPETLAVKGTVEPTRKKTAAELKKEKEEKKSDGKDYKRLNVYAIAYNEALDSYIVGLSGTYNFAVLDNKFKQVKAYKGASTGYTRQGCECDADYIYFTQSSGNNIVVIYDYNGKYVDTVTVDHTHEIENMFRVGTDFYLTLHYYGNSVQRVGLSKATRICFDVKYDPAGGDGEMKTTRVHFGEATKLSKCTFTRPGYFFGGWQLRRDYNDSYLGTRIDGKKSEWLTEKYLYDRTLYADEQKVSALTKIGSVTATAFWINESYDIEYDSGTGEGWMDTDYIGYDDVYTVPECGFSRQGYVFSGFSARRSCDGRVYGYHGNESEPRWLRPNDVSRQYLFTEGERVSRLTYDGTVTFTAQFSLAFIFDETYSTLTSYIGLDEYVEIPDPAGRLDRIASGAFSGNDIMTELTIPPSVKIMEPMAVSDCSALDKIVFEDSFPGSFDSLSVFDSGAPLVYMTVDGRRMLLGCFSDSHCAALISNRAKAIDRSAAVYRSDQ